MSKSKDPTARVFPASIMQQLDNKVTRELLIVDNEDRVQLSLGIESPYVNTSMTQYLSLAELDIALDKLHAVRDAMQAREDAKPIFTAKYPASFLDTEEFEVTKDQLLIRAADGEMVSHTEPVPGRGLATARSALAEVGYEVVKTSPGPEGVFEYVVRKL